MTAIYRSNGSSKPLKCIVYFLDFIQKATED